MREGAPEDIAFFGAPFVPQEMTLTHCTHELTDVEHTFGVTLAQVAQLLPKGVFIDFGDAFVLPEGTDPTLATSTARAAFGGHDAEYAGHDYLGHPVYRRKKPRTSGTTIL